MHSEREVHDLILTPLTEGHNLTLANIILTPSQVISVQLYYSDVPYEDLELLDGTAPKDHPLEYVSFFFEQNMVRGVQACPTLSLRPQPSSSTPPVTQPISPPLSRQSRSDPYYRLPPKDAQLVPPSQPRIPARIVPPRMSGEEARTRFIFYLLLCTYVALGNVTLPLLIRGVIRPGTPFLELVNAWLIALPGLTFIALIVVRQVLIKRRSGVPIAIINALGITGFVALTLQQSFSTSPYNTASSLLLYLGSITLLIVVTILITITIFFPTHILPHQTQALIAGILARRLRHLVILTVTTMIIGLIVAVSMPVTPLYKIVFAAITEYLFMGIFLWIGSLYAKKHELEQDLNAQSLDLPDLPSL